MFTPERPAEGSTPPRQSTPAQPWQPSSWPAPGAPAPIVEVASSSEAQARPRASTRRRFALAAIAVATIAGGTIGGAIAGSARTDPISASSPSPVFHSTSVDTSSADDGVSGTAGSTAKVDVTSLIDATLPSVVSITVDGPSGGGAGSGFVISADGEIATNAHVVADMTDIEVAFADGTTTAATVLGVDRTDDLAVIKVDRSGLQALVLGDSAALRMGEPVVAIGNALDLTGGPTATEGIVSAVDRTIDTQDGEHLTHMIQTDAAINPGNSGGPLLTLDGKVVGINSAGSRDAQNIGFSIAVDTAKPIIEQLQAGKTVTKAYLGVSTTPIDASVQAQYGLDLDHGLLVVDVAGDSAAQTAGVRAGDVIVSINGKVTDDNTVLGDEIRATGAGNAVHLVIHRGGDELTIDAVLSTHIA
jgi:S1-C subfamily serine protease